MACTCCFGSPLPADSSASIQTRQLGERSLALVGGLSKRWDYFIWFLNTIYYSIFLYYFDAIFVPCSYSFYVFTTLGCVPKACIWCDKRGQNEINRHTFYVLFVCWMGRRRNWSHRWKYCNVVNQLKWWRISGWKSGQVVKTTGDFIMPFLFWFSDGVTETRSCRRPTAVPRKPTTSGEMKVLINVSPCLLGMQMSRLAIRKIKT